ncbi:MAG: hypothetical protein AB1797_02680 [bacterium]
MRGEYDINDKGWDPHGWEKWPISIYYGGPYNEQPVKIAGKTPAGRDTVWWVFFHYDFGGPDRNSPSTWYKDYHDSSGLYNDTIYAHVFPSGDKAVIQYWLFYPFNDWVNNHEGDWEHINVGVTSQDPATAKIEYVDYYFHHSVKRCTQPGVDFFVDDETHPVIFVGGYGMWTDWGATGKGHGSHGCYPVKGGWERVERREKIEDFHEYIDGSGEFLSYQTFDLKVIPNKDEIIYGEDPDLYWMRSNVPWGHRNVNSPGEEAEPYIKEEVGNSPPRTPTFHPGWNDEGTSGEHKEYS